MTELSIFVTGLASLGFGLLVGFLLGYMAGVEWRTFHLELQKIKEKNT